MGTPSARKHHHRPMKHANMMARRLIALSRNLIIVAYLASLPCDAAQKHPILNLQHQHHSSYTKSPLNSHQNVSSRPLERPSLNLATARQQPQQQQQRNFSAEPHPEGAADWFMMGGGDLAPSEDRHHAAFLAGEESRPSRRSNMTRRMAEVKQQQQQQQQKHATGKSNATFSSGSKTGTIFDDEQQPSESADSNEIYDDIEENPSHMAGTSKQPDCASHGRYYCTFKEDYPLKLVTEVTKYYKWPLEKLFRDLHAQIMPKLAPDSTGNLVCDSVTRVVRPGWARNTNERWLVVINTDNYHQYVTEVVCQYGTNSRCNFIPPCYYSSCQQRYNTQKLLVIDPLNPYRGPFLSEFLFPSCCVCYVPAASDTFQDKYRSSPATIYQRTMQQEAASNLNPPQFRPPGLSMLEEAISSGSNFGAVPALTGGAADSRSSGNSGGGGGGAIASNNQQPLNAKLANNQPAGPGEIRREGELYRRPSDQQQQQADESRRQGRRMEPSSGDLSEFSSFPRLGLSDSLVDQKAVPKD